MPAADRADLQIATPDGVRVRTDTVPARAGNRVWFGWLSFWAAFFSAVLSPGVVVQSAFRPTAATFRAWMRPWGRAILAMARIRLRVESRAPLPEGPVVFVANHQNALDIPATSVGIPRPYLYVARHELRSWPVVGWVLEKTACLFISRDNPRKAMESLIRAGERIRGGESVLLFPEGGRSHSHETKSFMRGSFVLAIEAGVPVVPVALVGHPGVIDEKARAARPGEIRLVLGAPIPTEGLRRADSADLCARVKAVIDAELARFG